MPVLLVSPNGKTTRKSSLAAAVAALDAPGSTVVVTDPITIDTITIPIDIELEIRYGGSISINVDNTLTINGHFVAGPYQVFSGDGTVIINTSACVEVVPQWWGAIGDDTTDCTTAIQSAVDACIGGTVFLSSGVYQLTDVITLHDQMTIRGENHWMSALKQHTNSKGILTANGDNNSVIQMLNLIYDAPESGADAILISTAQTWLIKDIWITGCDRGIVLATDTGNIRIDGVTCYDYLQSAFTLDASAGRCNDILLTNSRFGCSSQTMGASGAINLYGWIEAFVASDVDITKGQYGLIMNSYTANNERGYSPWYNKFSNVWIDSTKCEGMILIKSSYTDFVNCWVASSGYNNDYSALDDYKGISLTATQHTTFVGGQILGNGGFGCVIPAANTNYTTFNGVTILQNRRGRNSDGAGIEVEAGATDFSVVNCMFKRDADTTSYRQAYSVNVNTGASDRYLVRSNILGGCTNIDNGTGSNKLIDGNY